MFSWQEWIGYLASILVALSLLMSSVKRLRWINMIGSFVFAIYGLVIMSVPVLLMNTFLVFVNLWFLIKLKQSKNTIIHLKSENWEDALVRKFMCKNHKLLKVHFPSFNYLKNESQLFMIYSGFEIVGFISGLVYNDTLNIEAVYIIPKYKDFGIPKKLLVESKMAIRSFGAQDFRFNINEKSTRDYLKQYGFNL